MIGGEFELKAVPAIEPYNKGFYCYASGRAALYQILKSIKLTTFKVWLPDWLCESMIDAVKKAGLDYGFYTSGDHNLIKVTLPESIEFIGQCAFIWCTNLEEINFPEGLSQISNSAFVGCEKLKNVVLPEWLEKVEATVFSSCISINDITIPENVNEIESGAFSGCESLKKITILNPECVIEDTPTTICNIYDYDENFNETNR